jgi:hypothetical protein
MGIGKVGSSGSTAIEHEPPVQEKTGKISSPPPQAPANTTTPNAFTSEKDRMAFCHGQINALRTLRGEPQHQATLLLALAGQFPHLRSEKSMTSKMAEVAHGAVGNLTLGFEITNPITQILSVSALTGQQPWRTGAR